jgi:hypothetical protein
MKKTSLVEINTLAEQKVGVYIVNKKRGLNKEYKSNTIYCNKLFNNILPQLFVSISPYIIRKKCGEKLMELLDISFLGSLVLILIPLLYMWTVVVMFQQTCSLSHHGNSD